MSMDGSAAGRSPRRSALPLMVVTLAALSSPGLGSACTPSINIPANSKVSQSKEQPLSLRCSVHLCSKDLPNVTWCRLGNGQNNLCQPVIPDDRISSGWKNNNENEAVHVLTFNFMHLNETGYYKCTAGFNGIQIVGRGINVILSDELMAKTTTMNMLSSNDTDSTSIPIIPVLEQLKILVYVMASAGGLCLIIIIISLLVFCLRRRREKYGSSTDPEKAEEVQFVATSVNPENGLELSEVSCPPGKEFTTVPTETTYDNAHLGYRSSLPLSPEEDSIIYADLKHEDKKAHFQFEEEVEVEYATVHLK